MPMLARLLSPFSSRKGATPPPGMRTIPCTMLDISTARDLVLTTGLVINARLDTKKLDQTLSTLVQSKFPRAGSRLALRNGVRLFRI
jgi:hypothetical protein